VNPGGPGGSGESLVRGGFGASLGEALNREFDIVGFDPRGVGRSIPVTCFDSNNEFETFFEGSFLFPYLKEQRADYYNLLNSLTSKCVSRRQPLLSRMNTANVARDLDLLRAAVGDSKLTYLGSRMEVRLASTMPTCFLSAFAPS
jgi:pimeloyl-ACP methyl ester carboxylesterase